MLPEQKPTLCNRPFQMSSHDRMNRELIGKVKLVDVSPSFSMEATKRTTELPLDYP